MRGSGKGGRLQWQYLLLIGREVASRVEGMIGCEWRARCHALAATPRHCWHWLVMHEIQLLLSRRKRLPPPTDTHQLTLLEANDFGRSYAKNSMPEKPVQKYCTFDWLQFKFPSLFTEIFNIFKWYHFVEKKCPMSQICWISWQNQHHCIHHPIPVK